jgi:hypothetical protein
MAKKRTTITVDEELLEFARRLGLNLSGFLEERLEGKGGCGENSGPDQTSKNNKALREGFEPQFTGKF